MRHGVQISRCRESNQAVGGVEEVLGLSSENGEGLVKPMHKSTGCSLAGPMQIRYLALEEKGFILLSQPRDSLPAIRRTYNIFQGQLNLKSQPFICRRACSCPSESSCTSCSHVLAASFNVMSLLWVTSLANLSNSFSSTMIRACRYKRFGRRACRTLER